MSAVSDLLEARGAEQDAAIKHPRQGAAAPAPVASGPTDVGSLLEAHAASDPQAAPVNQEPGILKGVADRGNAVGTGFLRSLLTQIPGLPVDTGLNVLDLGKAAVGTAYHAATGKPIPSALELTDRSKIPGSSEYLHAKLSSTAPGHFLVDPSNPDYEGGYLQGAGGAMTAAVGSPSVGGAVRQVMAPVAGAAAGKAVYDSTGDPALAASAAMAPGAAPGSFVAAGTKRLIRGDENGRQAMLARLEALKAAGVTEPTLGLASGNNAISGAENLLSATPGAVSTMARARARTLAGLQATVDSAVDAASPTRGPLASGQAIQRDVQNFYDDRVRPGYVRLNDNAEGVIGTNTPIQVTNTVGTTGALSTPSAAAPEVTGGLVDPRIRAWYDQFSRDQGGSPGYVDAAGMYHPEVPPTGIPFGTVKTLRTTIGNEAKVPLIGPNQKARISQVYDALSDDMMNGAVQSDLDNGKLLSAYTPSSASGALTRANRYYASGMDRLKAIGSFGEGAPEDTYNSLVNSAKSRNSVAQTVLKSVSPDTRGSVASTFVENLGKASPGQQNASGDVWSPETFLTNWNKLTPEAQATITGGFPGAGQVSDQVGAVANAASMLRDNKLWKNPSGTAAATHMRELAGLAGAGLTGLINPLYPLVGIPAELVTARLAAEGVTNPGVVNWAASPTTVGPTVDSSANVARGALGTGTWGLAQPGDDQN